MSIEPRWPTEHLYRPWMIAKLVAIAIRWDELGYVRYCYQAFSEINPDRLEDRIHNFSNREAMRAWLNPLIRRLRRGTRQPLEDYLNRVGRPSTYAATCCDLMRHRWNSSPRHRTRQLGIVPYLRQYSKKPTKLHPENYTRKWHLYVRPVRGEYEVNALGGRLEMLSAAMIEKQRQLSDCLEVDAVDESLAQILRENIRIQRGG